jgi:hypothetical protein
VENLISASFYDVRGSGIELFCENRVALRTGESNILNNSMKTFIKLAVQQIVRPYLFINVPMHRNDELYIRILSVNSNYSAS